MFFSLLTSEGSTTEIRLWLDADFGQGAMVRPLDPPWIRSFPQKKLWLFNGFHSQKWCVATLLRGSYGKSWGPYVFNRGGKCRRVWHFPFHFHTKWLLWNVHVHFDCAGSRKTMVPGDAPGISPVNFHTKWFSWHVHVHFDCADSRKTFVAVLTSGIFPVYVHTQWRLWHVHVHFACAGSHETRVAVLVSCIFPCTLGLVVCSCALRPLLGSLHRDLAKKPVM